MDNKINWHLEKVEASPADPTAHPVTLAQARAQLRLDSEGSPAAHADDDLIQSLIATATMHIDGKDGWLGRALITQTWDMVLDAFPDEYITIPLPPLQQVESITYTDGNGDQQTWDAGNYIISQKSPARVYPAYGKCFPSARCQPGAVRVRFVAGYGDEGSDVPEPIQQWLLMKVAQLYENREELPATADALITPLRIISL